MGIGDEIMCSGEVRRLAAGRKRRYAISDARKPNLVRWHPIWEGNPLIARPAEAFDERYYNAGGQRPYIVAKTPQSWKWREYDPSPGQIFLNREEQNFGRAFKGKDFVLIQPGVKLGASINKQWGLERWEELVSSLPSVRWVQVVDGSTSIVPGVEPVVTATFREACAVMQHATAAVLQEGGMHHAAAAIGTPAVVIFGGFISPRCTGYVSQRNLFMETSEHPLGCGLRIPCRHCELAMTEFSPNRVRQELEALL